MKLKDKFAVVAGASTGIGRAVAAGLGREGERVALVSRTRGRLEKTTDRLSYVDYGF